MGHHRSIHPNSIQNRMFLSILLFLIVPTLITLHYMGEPLERSVEEEINASQRELMSLVAGNLQLTADRMINSLIALTYDQNVIRMLNEQYQLSEYERMKASDNIMTTLTNTYLAEFRHYITIMDFTGNLYTNWYAPYGTYELLREEAWYEEVRQSGGQLLWLRHAENTALRNKEPLLSVARVVQGSAIEGYGVAMISVPVDEFRKLLQALQGESLLADAHGVLMSVPGGLAIGSGLLNEIEGGPSESGTLAATIGDTSMSIHYRAINNTDWTLIQLNSHDILFGDINRIRRMNTLVIIVIFLLFTAISFSISQRISRPLRLLNKKMASIASKDFNSFIPVKGADEVAGLIRAYNNMLRQIKALLARLKMEYQLKEQLRFKMLQAQINPHFILNTLSNVKWMAYMRRADEVGDMLSSLAVILEAGLGKDAAIIPLKVEIEYIRHYVILQKIKYNEKLVVDYAISDDFLGCEVIRFILQPVVENAIYHGLEKKPGTGHIAISAYKEQANLVMEVKDDGAGMDQATLESVRGALADSGMGGGSPAGGPRDSIGLVNVHQRIRLHYGAAYGIAVDSDERQGTSVRITLPYQTGNEGTDDVSSDDCGR